MQTDKKDIRSLTKEQLQDFFVSKGEKAFRGKQVYEWLWSKSAHDFSDMTNISKEIREMLDENFVINHTEIHQMQTSKDGTIKNAVRLFDGLIVESVLIPTQSRTTACVSSQVGCSLDCKFCATARLKRMRNLNPDEIYDQVVTIDRQSRKNHNRPLSNIVFMGMGEPLMNYNNVMKAIDKMADDEVKFKLAVSLHSAIEEIRNEIMPFTKNFPLTELKEALQYWYSKTKSKVTYEYVFWKGINDDKKSVEALVKLCKHVPCKVNLIEYNPIDDGVFQQASDSTIDHYIQALEKADIVVKVRRSRGKDIDAACGQLANKN